MTKVSLGSQDLVAETLLIPLYARAMEAQRPDAMLRDERAAAMVGQIDYDFSQIKLRGHDQATIIMRERHFDQRVRDFLARCPDGVVVHIGCGLDTRFERVDNGRVEWYDLDLPEVMELRRKLIGEAPRSHALACSVFDTAWLDTVSVHGGRPFLFVAEAVLPYFEEAQVKELVVRLKERFAGAELVCDAMTPPMVRMLNWELAISLAKVKARLHWGLSDPQDMEGWSAGIRLVDKWYYFDRPEPRLGPSQLMRYIPPLANTVYVLRYRLSS